jgi:hypothetical protein
MLPEDDPQAETAKAATKARSNINFRTLLNPSITHPWSG